MIGTEIGDRVIVPRAVRTVAPVDIAPIVLCSASTTMNELLISMWRAYRGCSSTHPALDTYQRPAYPTNISKVLPDASSNIARFDPSGRFVAAGALNGVVRVWDLETKDFIRLLRGHVDRITTLECVDHK